MPSAITHSLHMIFIDLRGLVTSKDLKSDEPRSAQPLENKDVPTQSMKGGLAALLIK